MTINLLSAAGVRLGSVNDDIRAFNYSNYVGFKIITAL
jgi:hypothetical protein